LAPEDAWNLLEIQFLFTSPSFSVLFFLEPVLLEPGPGLIYERKIKEEEIIF